MQQASMTTATEVKEGIFEEGLQAQRQQQQQQTSDISSERFEKGASFSKQLASSVSSNTNNSGAGQQLASKMASLGNCCAGCREPIKDKFIFSVIDLHWHQDCVQCADCSLKLNERCYEFEGKLYCKFDYLRRFGPKCFACRELIERGELVQRIKGNRVYHLKCFTCNDCNKQLKAGEQINLVDGKLLCKQDYHLLNKLTSSQLANSSGGGAGIKSSNGFNAVGGQTPTSESQQTGSYYTTLMSSQQQQQQHLAVEASKQRPEARLATAGEPTKPARDEAGGCLHNEEELDEIEGPEDEIEEDELDEEEMDGCDDEVDESGEHCGIGDEDECDELAASGDAKTMGDDEMTMGYDNDNNLENEENHSLVGFDHLSGGSKLKSKGNQNSSNNNKQQQQQQQQQQHHYHQQQQQLQQVNGAKRRRRRKGKLEQLQQETNRRSQVMFGGGQGNKKLANRNGESILNGSSGANPSASILANVHPVSIQQQQQAGHLSQHNSQSNSTSNNNNNKSVSSSASTASNSSTSSSLSQHQHHHSQQQQQQQQQQHHHHHHHNQQQQQPHNQTGPNQTGGHKPTRVRTVLNEKQLQTLRDCYNHNPRPDALMKEQLVDLTGLSPRVIRVWFQNKRCKDKKKSILYKQMQQHEKDGRHLAGLTLMRGVPMVASSPIQYDDHSTVSSTPTGQPQSQQTTQSQSQQQQSQQQQQQQQQQQPAMLELQPRDSSGSPNDQQRQLYPPTLPATVHSPPTSVAQPLEIHAYQPPWKSLLDYAQQQQQPNAAIGGPTAPASVPNERLNAASPRYQQLMGQIHGYNTTESPNERTGGPQIVDAQRAQFPTSQPNYLSPVDHHHSHLAALSHQHQHQQQHQHQPAPMSHLHQFQL